MNKNIKRSTFDKVGYFRAYHYWHTVIYSTRYGYFYDNGHPQYMRRASNRMIANMGKLVYKNNYKLDTEPETIPAF